MLHRKAKAGDIVLLDDIFHKYKEDASAYFTVGREYKVKLDAHGKPYVELSDGSGIALEISDIFWPWQVLKYKDTSPKSEIDYYKWLSERE